MKNDYNSLSEQEKLKHWESTIAHKIRSQAEVGDDSMASLTDEFFTLCELSDANFIRFIPELSKRFPTLKSYKSAASKVATAPKKISDPIKTFTLIFALAVFFGMQIMLIAKIGLRALIFIGIVDGLMCGVYGIAALLDMKSKRLYEELAAEKHLSFQCGKGSLPGLLYWPRVEGIYKGFRTNLSLSQKWTGRWVGGLQGLGQPQTRTSSNLQFFMPRTLTDSEYKKVKEELKSAGLKGEILLQPDLLLYTRPGAIDSKKMKEDISRAYDFLAQIAKNSS